VECIACSWVGSGGLGGVHVEQFKEPGLQGRRLRDDRRVVAAGGDQPQTTQRLEDQPPGGLGRLADIQPVQGEVGGDGAADLAFDQAEDQQGRQITVTSAWMRRLDCTNSGATASGPLNAP
jgi:hypothetical protein